MRIPITTIAIAAALAAAATAQPHDGKFLMGGYSTTSSLYWNGVWVADAAGQQMKHLTPNVNVYNPRRALMAADNVHVVFTAEGTTSTTYSSWLRSGIYSVDPSSLSIATIYHDTLETYAPYHLIVNQDGDFVFNCYGRTPSSSANTYKVMKIDAARNLTTILDSTHTGGSFTAYGLGVDVDTGHYLVNLYQAGTFYYSVLTVAEDGTFTTFAGGPLSSQYGWYGYYSQIEQNFATGDIEGYYSRNLYRLQRGSNGPRTTLYQLGLAGGYTMYSPGRMDNQSATSRRYVAAGYENQLVAGATTYLPAVFHVDADPPYAVTSTTVDPQNTTGKRYNYPYQFDFFGSRHVQPIKMGSGKWDVRLSCPRFAGKSYLLAVGASGVRPAIPLRDGRKIHLLPDTLTQLSLAGMLKPIVDAGPGILDAKGEALGRIDLGAVGKLGVPIWLQLIVLDPAAPEGIAYIPDPFVMRV